MAIWWNQVWVGPTNNSKTFGFSTFVRLPPWSGLLPSQPGLDPPLLPCSGPNDQNGTAREKVRWGHAARLPPRMSPGGCPGILGGSLWESSKKLGICYMWPKNAYKWHLSRTCIPTRADPTQPWVEPSLIILTYYKNFVFLLQCVL